MGNGFPQHKLHSNSQQEYDHRDDKPHSPKEIECLLCIAVEAIDEVIDNCEDELVATERPTCLAGIETFEGEQL